MLKKIIIFVLLLQSCFVLPALAQSRQQMANLFQDVELLKQEVGQMRLELERLLRDNENLQKQLKQAREESAQARADYQSLVLEMNQRLERFRVEVEAANKASKDSIIETVSSKMEQFVLKTQKAFDAVATQSQPTRNVSTATVQKEFSQDFPQQGVEYSIKKGDNLWKIAKEYDSKVSWIQNANRISDASKLRVGQLIFIPQQ